MDISRVCVKASPALGGRRLHQKTDSIDIAQRRRRATPSPQWWVPQTQGTSQEVLPGGEGRRGEGGKGGGGRGGGGGVEEGEGEDGGREGRGGGGPCEGPEQRVLDCWQDLMDLPQHLESKNRQSNDWKTIRLILPRAVISFFIGCF